MNTQQRLAELAGITLINEAVDVEWTKARLEDQLANIATSLEQITLKTDRLRKNSDSTSDDTDRAGHLNSQLRKSAEVSKLLALCQRNISDVLRWKF